MFIPNYYYQNYDRNPTEPDMPLSEIRLEETVAQNPKKDIQWEKGSIKYTQENAFFKGFLYMLPASILIWTFFIWVVSALWR